MPTPTSSPRSNPVAAFAAVMSPARSLTLVSSPPRVEASEAVANFVGACRCAMSAVALAPDTELLPDVDVKQPASVLIGFLLFLATEGEVPVPGTVLLDDRVARWHERVAPDVWKLMDFDRPPSRLTLQLAFSLLVTNDHLAPAMRPLVWAVGDFAASGLMPELRQ